MKWMAVAGFGMGRIVTYKDGGRKKNSAGLSFAREKGDILENEEKMKKKG